MTASDRREVMRLIGALALLPTVGSVWVPPLQASELGRPTPRGDFRLTRTVERSLSDGELLTVSRSWSCRFDAYGRGMRVESFEQSCIVEAPAGLEAIAAMEMRRREDGPFPALLGANGLIQGGESNSAGADAEAIDAALDILLREGLKRAEIEQARSFMTRLSSAAGAAISAIPADLFFPRGDVREFSRPLPLPGGAQGEVTVRLTAIAAKGTGLLERIERRVETRVGSDIRLSREDWTLVAI